MAWGAIIGGIASAAGSVLGAAKSGSQSEGLSKYQLDYQRDMSNTAHQRQMRDLRNAGLNPILAARLGGAGNVSPVGANIPDYGRAASAGIQGAMSAAAVQQKDAQVKQLTAQTNLTNQVTKTEAERTRLTNSQAGLADSQTALNEIQTLLKNFEIPKGRAGEQFWDALGAAIHGISTAKDISSGVKAIRDAFSRFGVRKKGAGGNAPRKKPLRIKIPYKDK